MSPSPKPKGKSITITDPPTRSPNTVNRILNNKIPAFNANTTQIKNTKRPIIIFILSSKIFNTNSIPIVYTIII